MINFKEIKSRFSNLGSVYASISNEEVSFFEEKYQVKFSKELKNYFQVMNGVTGLDFITEVRPLSEWIPVLEYDWFRNYDFTQSEMDRFQKSFVMVMS